MTYDNIKSHKKQGFIVSLEDTFFGKQRGDQIEPASRFRIKKGSNFYFDLIFTVNKKSLNVLLIDEKL